MDWMKFIVELIRALAWPTAIIIIVILFRKPIYQLIPFLKKIKWKDLEFEFSREVVELRKESDKSFPDYSESLLKHEVPTSELFRQALASPKHAILEAWKEVELEAINCIKRNDIARNHMVFINYRAIGNLLLKAKVFDNEQYNIFIKLKELRNKVIHIEDFFLSVDDSLDYVISALRLATYLRNKNTNN